MSLTLIAGSGRLPQLIAPHAEHIAALDGVRTSVEAPHRFRLETLGTFLADLKARGTTRICLAGAVPRPTIDTSRIDAATLPLAPRIAQALTHGDDGALGVALQLFEEHGIQPVGAHEVRPDLLPPAGDLGRARPTDRDALDIARGFAILGAIGTIDIGQGCVVASGLCLAVETLPGTDWMLQTVISARAGHRPSMAERTQRDNRLVSALDGILGASAVEDRETRARQARADHSTEGRAPDPESPLAVPTPPGGVLVKAPKAGQDRRADLPAIGPDTVRRAAEAQLSGIAIRQGGVLVLDPDECAGLAEERGIWIRIAE